MRSTPKVVGSVRAHGRSAPPVWLVVALALGLCAGLSNRPAQAGPPRQTVDDVCRLMPPGWDTPP